LTGTSLLQAWIGTWLLLTFRMLSLLKPEVLALSEPPQLDEPWPQLEQELVWFEELVWLEELLDVELVVVVEGSVDVELVVVVEESVWLGFRLQVLWSFVVELPVFTSPSRPEMSASGTWPTMKPALTGTSLLQAWIGTWFRLTLRMLSLLKPLGLLAALAAGAAKPTSAAVAMARAKARFFPDILYVPPFNMVDSSRGSA
jgi:hypothetical protein